MPMDAASGLPAGIPSDIGTQTLLRHKADEAKAAEEKHKLEEQKADEEAERIAAQCIVTDISKELSKVPKKGAW